MNPPILYLNGLGNGEWQQRQRRVLNSVSSHGYDIEHAHINWLSGKSFEDHLEETVAKAETLIKERGRVAIVGSSAGGSMAINTFSRLPNENVVAINMCGRLAEGSLNRLDWRKLAIMAHLGTARASQSFFESVKYCEEKVMPELTLEQKKRLFVFHQLFDFVVPHETMLILDVQNRQIPVIGHGLGIFVAGLELPTVLERLETKTAQP